MKQNKKSYNEVLNWAKEHKVHAESDYTIIARYNNTTQNLDNRLLISEIEEVINCMIVNDTKYLEQMEKDAENKMINSSSDIVCSVCYSSICIEDNGNVYPCAGWQGYSVGNAKDTPLKEIWDNSEKIQYLRSLRKKDFPKCIQCFEKDFCTMCLVRNANEHPQGDLLTVNEYFCNIAKLNKKIVFERKEKLVTSLNQYS
jgi:radical SAM protein with 4Fe4S-binding SPASM domain